MSKYGRLLILSVIAVLVEVRGWSQTPSGQSDSPQVAQARAACASDVQKLCAGVPSGGGRIVACLKQHKGQVSDGCKQAILAAMGQSGAAAPPATSSAPAGASPAPATPSASPVGHPNDSSAPVTTATQSASYSSKAGSGPGDPYIVMKQVKIIDQGLGQGKPAYDLLIPKDWQFKGAVNVREAEGGCFGDWFSVFGVATSPDNSVEFQMAPQFTWQYMDDPAGQRQMQTQNQADAKFGMKPCPVRAPIKAEEFLRKDMVPNCTKACKNTTVVSVEAFPELEEMVRHQLGLSPGNAGGNTRVDAARAHIAFDDDKGQPAEGWMAAAIVVNTIPGSGRGAAYDWHAVNVLFFRVPKGQLEANDKLFKLIMSTIRPEPEWRKWSNGVIASLYQEKQKQLAIQSQMIAQFRAHVADVINGVTANSEAGANQAAFGQDQIIRGVQTFRDPSTGANYELSNLYDHAWLNGQNEYVMSDSPNFNPNGNLDGNWNQLQVVRPQP